MRKWGLSAVLLLTLVLGMHDITGQFGVEVARPKALVHTPHEPKLVPARQLESLGALAPITSSPGTPLGVAWQYLNEHASELQLRDYHHFKPQVMQSPLGAQVKFLVYQDELPLLGSSIEVDVSTQLEPTLNEIHYRPVEKADVSSASLLSPEQIFQNTPGYRFRGDGSSAAKVLYLVPGGDRPVVAYAVPAQEVSTGRPLQILLRASDGQVLRKSYSLNEF